MKKNTRIFILLSILLALSDCIFVGINYISGRKILQNNFEEIGQKIRASYDQAISASNLRMLQIATFTAADTEVQNLFLAGKRAVAAEGGGPGGPKAAAIRSQLYNKVQSSRDALAADFDFRQLHFHLGPGSLSFLRVHFPEKFGDHMDTVRHAVVAVNKHKKAITGFETGRVYSGIRGIVPVYAADKKSGNKIFVGALEAGTSFNVMLSELAKNQNVEMAVLLTLNHLRSNVWPNAMKKLAKNNPPISGYFVEASTNPDISKFLEKNLLDPSILVEQKVSQVCLNDKSYSVTSFPLRDFIGSIEPNRPNVGVIVAWRNVQKEIDEFWANQRINITYGLLGFILIESFLYIGIRAITKKMRRLINEANLELLNSEKLLKEAQVIGKLGHWELNLETRKLDWSDEIYRIFGLQPQEFDVTYETFLKMIHPEERKRVSEKFKEAAEKLSRYQIEYRILPRDGSEKWVLGKGHAEYNEAEKPVRLIGTIQDITEINLLRGILPICSFCKKIRDDKGYWDQVEVYVAKHSDVLFSHSFCPECVDKHYPEFPENWEDK